MAARALADHFAEVTIVERDARPKGPEARKGAPQMRHVHALLEPASKGLERFLASSRSSWRRELCRAISGAPMPCTSTAPGSLDSLYDVMHMRRGLDALLRPEMLFPLIAYCAKSPFVPLERRINAGLMPRAA